MFCSLSFCFSGMVAGFIGMVVGLIGEIYIFEFSDRSDELLQAAIVFKELDDLCFIVCYLFMVFIFVICASMEVKRFLRRYRKRKKFRHAN